MGSKVAPVYATLAMGFLEIKMHQILPNFFNPNYCQYIARNWKRYLDDCFLIWDEREDLNNFFSIVNNLQKEIKFTIEKNKYEMDFLDILLVNTEGKITTDIYYKPTNAHRYLDFFSNHPTHTKRNVPLTLAQRVCSLVREDNKRQHRLTELKEYLLECKYPISIINRGFKEATRRMESDTHNQKGKDQDIIPLVITHCPEINVNMKMIRDETINSSNIQLQNLFKNSQIVLSRRQPKNLLRILCNNKYQGHEKEKVGVFPCHQKRCHLCGKNYIQDCNAIKDKYGNIIFHITTSYTCNSVNVIYTLKCHKCGELYVGQTENLRARSNLHKSHVIKAKNKIHDSNILPCSKHFAECNSNEKDELIEPYFQIIPFWHCPQLNKRLQFEKNFIEKFKAKLNI